MKRSMESDSLLSFQSSAPGYVVMYVDDLLLFWSEATGHTMKERLASYK